MVASGSAECPKCAAAVPVAALECPRCGVIFAKVAHRTGLAAPPSIVVADTGVRQSIDPLHAPVLFGKSILLAGLVVWTWQFAKAPMGGGAISSVLHLPNLVFHEAGHVLFGFFGRFITVLGGSLLQFALPLGLAVAFLRRRDTFGAAVCTWWAGENLLDLAPYIADARALQLVLLGGRTGAEVEGHDWEYLLAQLGWLRFDRILGLWAHRTGLLMMIGALIGAAIHLSKSRYQPHARAVAGAVLAAAALSWSAPQSVVGARAEPSIHLDSPFAAPRWARLERQLLADNVPACREFFKKYFDDRGYLQCVVRWGANDGPDDAFENFNRWPELHALGASDDIRRMFAAGHDGLIKQYTAARTTDVPIARQGMYYKEFIVQSDWMHHGEGLQLFNRMGLSMPADATYQRRARRFAGFYMGEDPEAPNYDPVHKIIRSMQNGSRGPMLRKATALDWVGDPFDVRGFDALHGESSFEQFLAHYQEYSDVVGDHFLNLVATTLPTTAYLIAGEAKYKRWLTEYMDAWLDRMKRNGGIIPSFVDLEGRIGGPDGQWWKNAYGWGFSPVNPVTGRREDRNRIPRALVGFSNALLVTGDQKYVDAWRTMIEAVNSHARVAAGRTQYPTMYGAEGWYGWRDTPWNVGALEVWYWSQRESDRARAGRNAWLEFLEGRNPSYPEEALERDAKTLANRLSSVRRDASSPDRRLADNMLDYNPATTEAMVQLMWGALLPGREGGLLNARLRYFDPDRKRAGLPEDVAALVSELSDTSATVTLVNLNPSISRRVIVQGGGYGEHQLISVKSGAQATSINAPRLTVHLGPGCGEKLVLTMRRYANRPTTRQPW
jgi:hypothetical protein